MPFDHKDPLFFCFLRESENLSNVRNSHFLGDPGAKTVLKLFICKKKKTQPCPNGEPLGHSVLRLSTDCSLKHRQVPHGSCSHGHDRSLALCVNDPGQSSPSPSSSPPRDRTRTLVPMSGHVMRVDRRQFTEVSQGSVRLTRQNLDRYTGR